MKTKISKMSLCGQNSFDTYTRSGVEREFECSRSDVGGSDDNEATVFAPSPKHKKFINRPTENPDSIFLECPTPVSPPYDSEEELDEELEADDNMADFDGNLSQASTVPFSEAFYQVDTDIELVEEPQGEVEGDMQFDDDYYMAYSPGYDIGSGDEYCP